MHRYQGSRHHNKTPGGSDKITELRRNHHTQDVSVKLARGGRKPLSMCCTATCTVSGLSRKRVQTLATQLTSFLRQFTYCAPDSVSGGFVRSNSLRSCDVQSFHISIHSRSKRACPAQGISGRCYKRKGMQTGLPKVPCGQGMSLPHQQNICLLICALYRQQLCTRARHCRWTGSGFGLDPSRAVGIFDSNAIACWKCTSSTILIRGTCLVISNNPLSLLPLPKLACLGTV